MADKKTGTAKVVGTIADLAQTVGLWAGVGSAALLTTDLVSGENQKPVFLPFKNRKQEAAVLGYTGAGLTVAGAIVKAFY
jgi:ABC-type thiamin/hydroxymethylpyrimidine transport system permease subunit